MRFLPAAFALALLVAAAASAKAEVEEVPLPSDAKGPLALGFDAPGNLWVTLDRT